MQAAGGRVRVWAGLGIRGGVGAGAGCDTWVWMVGGCGRCCWAGRGGGRGRRSGWLGRRVSRRETVLVVATPLPPTCKHAKQCSSNMQTCNRVHAAKMLLPAGNFVNPALRMLLDHLDWMSPLQVGGLGEWGRGWGRTLNPSRKVGEWVGDWMSPL